MRATLVDLIPRGQEHVFEQGVDVSLSAGGRRYRVAVVSSEKRAQKSYDDPKQDCEKRARVAAVFVFLTVMPPEVWADALEGEEGAALPEEPRSVSPESPSREPVASGAATSDEVDPVEDADHSARVRVELGGLLQGAPALGGAPSAHSLGGELRAVLGEGPVAGQLIVGYLPAAELVLAELQARLTRVPAGAGLRWSLPFGDWLVGLDLALHGELERVEATGLLQANDQSSIRWGTRGGVTVGVPGRRLFPFASLHATLLPERRELMVLPRGVVGEVPRLWLGATVGFALGL